MHVQQEKLSIWSELSVWKIVEVMFLTPNHKTYSTIKCKKPCSTVQLSFNSLVLVSIHVIPYMDPTIMIHHDPQTMLFHHDQNPSGFASPNRNNKQNNVLGVFKMIILMWMLLNQVHNFKMWESNNGIVGEWGAVILEP